MKSMLNHRFIIGSSVLVGLFAIGLAGVFSSYSETRVAPGIAFRILGPSSLHVGSSATVAWNTSTAGQKKYPMEKIEFCTDKIGKHCIVLAVSVPNNGKATMLVPSLQVEKGYLKLSARNPSGRLVIGISSFKSVVVIAQKAISSSEETGGGGSSGNNNDVNSDPMPSIISNAAITLLSPTNGMVIQKGEYVPVQGQLQWTSSDPYTCQTWLLDGKPVPQSFWANNKLPSADGSNYPPC
ncbi:MAG TPA: hypothetical protein VLG69_05280 [Candidatus Andersenbacteria bacterium]|nr:hypothetical protein [Candidatus Andersenbacteria bacterium]